MALTTEQKLAFEIARLQTRVDRLEKLVAILLYVSRETEDFWPYTTQNEQQLASDFYDEIGRQ